MPNPYYIQGESRAAKVNQLFSAIARRYDVMNDLQSFGLHRLWKRRLVRMAQIRPGQRVLDVCCGTGDLALASARRGASVVGIDFSDPMLAIARSREEKQRRPGSAPADSGSTTKPPNPEFMFGDAMNLAFSDDSFHVVMTGYGLRNLADWKLGLREMHRIARPGGKVLVLDFGKPANRFWRMLYFAYLRLALPVLGWLVCRDAAAYGYILESLEHYPAQEGVLREMRELGFNDVKVVHVLGGIMGINCGEKR